MRAKVLIAVAVVCALFITGAGLYMLTSAGSVKLTLTQVEGGEYRLDMHGDVNANRIAIMVLCPDAAGVQLVELPDSDSVRRSLRLDTGQFVIAVSAQAGIPTHIAAMKIRAKATESPSYSARLVYCLDSDGREVSTGLRVR